jgi:acrylyl-CoA reductase (NADPH)
MELANRKVALVRAFVIDESNGSFDCSVRDATVSPTGPDDLLIAVEFSGVNFIDAAGVVVDSADATVAPGTRVAVHGGEMGVARDGGFAEQVYAPRRYLNVLPDTISTRDAMIIGTAGFTAMASVLALEAHGLASGASVLVTGATGGVGSASVTFLSARGYEVTASTGSGDEAPWLRERGAAHVIGRDDVTDRPDKVLGSERWDGAIDCIGGATLAQILRSLRYGAAVAASGLVAGSELDTTVYPFITRAVSLLGVDAVQMPMANRARVWSTLGELVTRIDLEPLVDRVATLDELPDALSAVADGTTRGRVLVTSSAR